ncbi:MAG TPA: peptide chain release factor 2 [Spirochaetia bacterium]|nr:peptide chain release factor 2 [Spirochaetia bacterium]
MLGELEQKLQTLGERIEETWGVFDPDKLKGEIDRIEKETSQPDFWLDKEKAGEALSRLKDLKRRYEPWERLRAEFGDLQGIWGMAVEEKDESLEEDLRRSWETLSRKFDELKVLELLGDEADSSSAFVTIHSGAGGTEAEDWAAMLLRMYTRWAERRGYTVDIIDILAGEGGIKSVTAQVNGSYAYGYLKSETGIHRLVRISPFDSNARRHTSFASVFCFPVLDDTIEVDIRPEDLRIDTYRAGGAGGQHVNKTDSAVRITHLPTGIVVQCQNERSQYKNKAFAMKVLRSRLYEYYKEERDKEKEKLAQEKKDISWGNQIRSYTFQPYTLVKDHRTKHEAGNIQAVMDGEIDPFIEEYLKMQWLGKKDGGQRTDS